MIDYIGERTWVSEPYCDENSRSALKQIGYHGHALILLDELDEILKVGKRCEIVEFIKKFIGEYVRTPSFIPAFNTEIANIRKPYDWTDEIYRISSCKKYIRNQIVVTSRIVGYQLHSLFNPSIVYYTLSPRNNNEAMPISE